MPLAPDAAALAALLPGTWRVGATNCEIWLGGDRLRPQFRYDLKTADPLVLREVVSFTNAHGVEKTIVGVNRLRAGRQRSGRQPSDLQRSRRQPPDLQRSDLQRSDLHSGNTFVCRRSGPLRFVTSRWSVVGATEDSNILVIRIAKSLCIPAGVDVVVRDGTDSHAFRTQVAGLSESLGLTHGEFASLTWLELAD